MSLSLDLDVAWALAVAGLAGLAVGVERQWSGHASGPDARFAGARTFFLLGVLGGLAGWFLSGGLVAAGVLLLGAGSGLSIAAYALAARRGAESIDGTTEISALLVLAIGAVSGLGYPLLTSAIAAVMVLALLEKTRIHETIKAIGQSEFQAALRFAVLALVILPLLPAGPYGPFDSVRPRALWILVLLFSGLNFAGYLAVKAVGPKRGYGLTGLLGGLVSSTAVTLQFSRKSRDASKAGHALALGVIGACTVLLVRVLVVSAVLRPAVALALLPYFGPGFIVGAALYAVGDHRWKVPGDDAAATKNPLGLWSAITMAVGFQIVLLLVPLVQSWWGNSGVVATAAVLGLTDLDALTLAMSRLQGVDAVALAALGIAVGVLSNTGLKLAVVLVLGAPPFRRLAAWGLAVLGAAVGLGFWIAR